MRPVTDPRVVKDLAAYLEEVLLARGATPAEVRRMYADADDWLGREADLVEITEMLGYVL